MKGCSGSSRINEASSSDCLVPYLGHSLEESYPSAEMQSVYFTAPTDLATTTWKKFHLISSTVSDLYMIDNQSIAYYALNVFPMVRLELLPDKRSIDWLFFFYSVSNVTVYLKFLTIHSSISITGSLSRVFANGPEDRGSIPGRDIPKTLKMILDAAYFSTQHYKVRIKSKVEQSKERSRALPYTSV